MLMQRRRSLRIAASFIRNAPYSIQTLTVPLSLRVDIRASIVTVRASDFARPAALALREEHKLESRQSFEKQLALALRFLKAF